MATRYRVIKEFPDQRHKAIKFQPGQEFDRCGIICDKWLKDGLIETIGAEAVEHKRGLARDEELRRIAAEDVEIEKDNAPKRGPGRPRKAGIV